MRYFGAFDAKPGLARVEALVVLADQAGPAGVEEDDITLWISMPCFLAASSISLNVKAVPSFTTSVPKKRPCRAARRA